MKQHTTTTAIMVFARAPVPGQVKTRLIPALGEAGAADLQDRLLQHTLDTAERVETATVQLYGVPDPVNDRLTELAQQHGIPLKLQRGNDLGERMANAFAENLSDDCKAILVGCDCPALTAEHYRQVFTELEQHDAVFIPALDGGYVLIGLRRANSVIFENITWSTGEVMQQTRQQLDKAGLSWRELPPLHDIDRPEDLRHCPEHLLTGVSNEMAG